MALNFELNQKEREELLKIARQAIDFYLKYHQSPNPEFSDKLKEKRAVFVTLRRGEELRGCIGHLEARESLAEAVVKMAIAAATEDNRLLSVTLEELPEIKIEISILSSPQKISHPSQIELGKHGVIVKQGQRKGVFLPEVAEHFNYNLKEFLNSLCFHKAGLPVDAWLDPATEIYIFTTQKIKE